MKNKRVLPALLGSVALTLGLVTVSTSINKEVVNAAEEKVATYTITSASAVSASDAPSGSSATFKNTYTANKQQLTSGNSMTLTLSGYTGYTITGLTLSMKSNTSKGAGNLSVSTNSSTISSISTAKFNTSNWNGAWTTTFVEVKPKVNPTKVLEDEKITIKIAATENSLYCQSFKIHYTSDEVDSPDVPEIPEFEYPEAGSLLTIAEAIEVCEATGSVETTNKYMVEGVVENVSNSTYGNMTIKDSTGSLTIWGTYSSDGSVRYDAMTMKPEVGDTVRLLGTLVNYGGNTPEMTNAWIQSLTKIEKEPKVELKELLTKYVGDGVYTKKTSINIDSSSQALLEDLATLGFDNLFHAKASDLKRTTYYDGDALLMANYDGSLKNVGECTTGINSGYGTVNNRNLEEVKKVNKNAELGDMTHFKYNGQTQVYDYIVKKGQHTNWVEKSVDGMEGFYVTPKDFVVDNYFENWVKNSDNSYSLKNVDKDTQSDFINVVAPLLLEEMSLNYFTISELKVKENDGKLYLQIIADDDVGKLINGTNILAEATITDNCDVDFSYVNLSNTSIVFNFGENGSAQHKETTNAIVEYSTEVDGVTLELSNPTKIYKDCLDAKGNSCIKLGSKSAAGSFVFKVPENVNKVIIYVAGYKENLAKITVNGTTYEINTYSDNGEYTPIEIDTTSIKEINFTTASGGYRCMIDAIEFIKN